VTDIAVARTGLKRHPIDLVAVAALSAAWVVFFVRAATIGSGYHLVDDHEILRILADLRTSSLWGTIPRWVAGDLNIRFRPFYFVHRITETAVFGDRLGWWSLYTAALAPVTSILLYCALRTLRFGVLAALTFAILALFGEQACIWWRLGPNETIGMVCLAVALFGMARWARTGSLAYRVVFWIGAILASLSKESFVATLPAVALTCVCAVAWHRHVNWRATLAACLPEVVGFTTVFVLEGWVIVFFVGTEKIGYAGVKGITVGQVWVAATQLVRPREALTLLALAVVAIGARYATRSSAPDRDREWFAWGGPSFIAALVVASQAVLYARSGLWERYQAPGTLAVALLAACLAQAATSRHPGAEDRARDSNGLAWLLTTLVVPVVCVAILLPLTRMRVEKMNTDAAQYAAEGHETQALLDEIAVLPRDQELIVAGRLNGIYEQFWSIRWYLWVRLHREQVKFLFVQPDEPLTPFQRHVREEFDKNPVLPKFRPDVVSIDPFDAVAILRGDEAAFLDRAPWFPRSQFVRHDLPGSFALYIRRQ